MKIRNMLGLALIGGTLYAHKKHGGEWTVRSFKQSLRDLMDGIERGAERGQVKAKDAMREFTSTVSHAADNAGSAAEKAGDRIARNLKGIGERH